MPDRENIVIFLNKTRKVDANSQRRFPNYAASNCSHEEILDLLKQFGKDGFVFLKATQKKNLRRNLLSLIAVFGDIIDHVLADADGVVTIRPQPELEEFGHAFSNREMEFHTDGSFIVEPPNVVALQCETPADWGGSNCLVDGKALYEFLYRNFENEFAVLFDPGASDVNRRGENARHAIFSINKDRIQVCFRFDRSIDVSFTPPVRRLVPVIQSYLNDPSNQSVFKLAIGEIVVLDNRRMLHSRRAFRSLRKRRMNRIWMDGISQYQINCGFRPPIPGSVPRGQR